jgi:hypothetical protein
MNQHLGIYTAILLGPDKNPANGRLLASASRLPNGECPSEISALWKAGEVALGWSCDVPLKQLSPESLGKLRRTRLRNKLKSKFPLIADELFAREIALRPDFFAGKRG